MSLPRQKNQHWTAWLAACVIMLGALAPSVSHWLATSSSNSVWSQICSTQSKSTPAGDTVKADVHCPFCLPHDGSLGLPPQTVVLLDHPLLEQAEPFLFLHSPRPLFAWGSAQPRAPPVA